MAAGGPGFTDFSSPENTFNGVTLLAAAPPPTITGGQSFSVLENSALGTDVGTVGASDVTTNPSWSISSNVNPDGDGEDAFAINATTGQITVNDPTDLDYETNTSFVIEVSLSDDSGAATPVNVTINLEDVNEFAPVVNSVTAIDIAENLADNTPVGTALSADDQDGTTNIQNWAIASGNTNNAFAIDGSGQISVNSSAALDYETTTTFTLGITVDDDDYTSAEQTVTINLTDLNDVAPVVTASQSFTTDENTTAGTDLSPVLVATDGDVTSTTFSNWTISTNVDPDGDGTDAFAINASNGQITVNDAGDLDYETNTSLTIQVTVYDGANTSAPQDVTINLNNLNDEAPVITASQEFTVAENSDYGTVVGTVAVTDPDDASTVYHDWTITTGNTNGAFAINSTSGQITVANTSQLDRETTASFTLGLTVNDGTNTSAEATVTVLLSDVNDVAPVITASQSFDIPEGSSNGTVVGTVAVTDGDVTSTTFSSWTITNGNTDNAFAINGTTGEITVATSSALDIMVNPTFTLTLTVSDGVNTSADETVTINLTDINNQNPVVTNGQTFDVDENSAATTSVGTVAATDADSNTTFQDWTITSNVNGDGDANDAFAVDASTGEITVNDADDLDREANASLVIQVTVSDGTNTSVAENVTINLNDLNDVDPVVDSGQSFSIAENRPNGTVVGTAIATDGDVSSTTFQDWTIASSTTAGAFAINASTGEITVADSTLLDRETVASITLV